MGSLRKRQDVGWKGENSHFNENFQMEDKEVGKEEGKRAFNPGGHGTRWS